LAICTSFENCLFHSFAHLFMSCSFFKRWVFWPPCIF
jgi:hypothetical protein